MTLFARFRRNCRRFRVFGSAFVPTAFLAGGTRAPPEGKGKHDDHTEKKRGEQTEKDRDLLQRVEAEGNRRDVLQVETGKGNHEGQNDKKQDEAPGHTLLPSLSQSANKAIQIHATRTQQSESRDPHEPACKAADNR